MENYKIIVVDDEPAVQLVLETALEEAGYDVLAFGEATSALQRIDKYSPDLVISDIMMPGMDGITFCHRLKENTRLADIPFIFLTAVGDKEIMISGLEAGAMDYINKPVHLPTFLSKVSNILKRTAKKENSFSILVVDSSSLVLNVTKRKLNEAGFQVTTAKNVDSAMEWVHTKRYNLIISSVELKGLSGLDFCKMVKESVFGETPFVLLSAKVSEELLEKGMAAGVDDFWDKGIKPEGLVAKVRAAARQYEFSREFEDGMDGNLKDMAAIELIQMIGVNQKTGILSLLGSDIEGHIHFNNGNVVDAAIPDQAKGEDAFFSLLTLGSEGVFHFVPTEDAPEAVITGGFQGLLMDGAKILDDIDRIRDKKIIRLKEERDNLNKKEVEFLSHVNNVYTFDKIIKLNQIDAYQGFNLVTKLVEKGMIQPPLEGDDDCLEFPE